MSVFSIIAWGHCWDSDIMQWKDIFQLALVLYIVVTVSLYCLTSCKKHQCLLLMVDTFNLMTLIHKEAQSYLKET